MGEQEREGGCIRDERKEREKGREKEREMEGG